MAVVAGKPPLPNNIRSAFNNKEACFLFLGFGFKHWYLRILLHVLYQGGGDIRSFALEKFDDSIASTETETTKLFFQEGHKIYFFDMELDDFAAELRSRFEKQQEEKQEKIAQGQESELPPNAPRVFLCHASENKDYAQNLYEQLKNAGIQPWLDRENILGGDEWNPLIEKVIQREIDYFVVLQSTVMSHKIESYFHKEIDIALARQQVFSPGIRFVIPVLIEACERLDILSHLHTIDLTQPAGFKSLVSAIKRDSQLRIQKRSS